MTMKGPVRKLVVFDFDQTLSVMHVFKSLAGWERSPQLSPPFATTEIGQLIRMFELDKEFPHGFAHMALGGSERVAELRALFTQLLAAGCELFVCSKGLAGPIRKVLSDCGLLHHFAFVYANTREDYGSVAFDEECASEETPASVQQFLGEGNYNQYGGKAQLVRHLLQKRSLSKDCGILVEDDKREVEKASKECLTLLIDPPCGMTREHMERLKESLGINPAAPERGAGGSPASDVPFLSPSPPALVQRVGPAHGYDSRDPRESREKSSRDGPAEPKAHVVTRDYDGIELGTAGEHEGGYLPLNVGDEVALHPQDQEPANGSEKSRYPTYLFGCKKGHNIETDAGWFPADIIDRTMRM